jgi:hypothetical protein
MTCFGHLIYPITLFLFITRTLQSFGLRLNEHIFFSLKKKTLPKYIFYDENVCGVVVIEMTVSDPKI